MHSAAKFHWTEIIEVVTCQYGEALNDGQVNAIDWSTTNYLKRHPVTVAKQIFMYLSNYEVKLF